MREVLDLADEAATARLGKALAGVLSRGDVVALEGALGTGKTALARAAIRAATGNPAEEVPSPTFTLVQAYAAADGTPWWHFDLYRLNAPAEAVELGIDEAFGQGVSLIEWPERLGPLLPGNALRVKMALADKASPGARRAQLDGALAKPTKAAYRKGAA